jgi:hypothetical protein
MPCNNNPLVPMSKTRTSAPPSASGNAAPAEPPTYRQNPEVDAKIETYIKENPKYWAYIQGMPRERLERTLVLNEVRQLDRQQRMKEGILQQINKSPALKAAYETLVKDLPEEQREGVIAQLARQAKRAVARSQNQQQGRAVTVGAG